MAAEMPFKAGAILTSTWRYLLLRDIRFGLRRLWKDRAYATTAFLTLAVCFGANTAIFTIVHSVLLKPLPVPESDRILLMSNQYPKAGSTISLHSSVPDYYDRLRDMSVFEEQALLEEEARGFDINGTRETFPGMSATPSLFRMLHVAPIQGRIFDESEGEVGKHQKIILSYGLWQQMYGGQPAVGREIRFGNQPYEIVGVMPRSFIFFNAEVRFWIPLTISPERKLDSVRHQNGSFNVGRLKAGTTIEQARQQLNILNAANLERFPESKPFLISSGFYTRVDRLQDVLVRSIKPTLYFLWGGAAFVLLIGAVNIVNLTLARSNLRMKELSTCLALGAARSQVARQLIVESSLLGLGGGAAGLLAGSWILAALQMIGLDQIPRASEIQMDATVAVCAMATSVIIGVVIGLVPVLHFSRTNVNAVLHEQGRTGTASLSSRAAGRILVVTQVAFAFILLIGSGLLLASFRNLLGVDPGFKADGVITARIWASNSRYPKDDGVRLFTNSIVKAIRNIPGVVNAGATTSLPLGNFAQNHDVIIAEGQQVKPGESVLAPMQIFVTPGYFETMRTPLVRGRYFTDDDNEKSPRVVIVDDKLARKFWPGADPIGKRMYEPNTAAELLAKAKDTPWMTVVGVVRDVRLDDLAAGPGSGSAYYYPAAQMAPRGVALAIRTAGNPAAVLSSVRSELSKLDPDMPLSSSNLSIRTMGDYVSVSLMPRRATMLLATSFALVSVFLSALGIYGLLAYLVTQRSREIGIRMALGSTARGIFSLFLKEGLSLVAFGLALGLTGSLALKRAFESQVYGLSPMDPTVTAIVLATLALIALVASTLPARRAAQVDPVRVLNQQ
jgi:predicted permease